MTTEQSPLSEAELAAKRLYDFVGSLGVHGHEPKPWDNRSEDHKQLWRNAVAEVRRSRTGGTAEGQTAPMAWIEYAGPVPIAEIAEGALASPPTPIPAGWQPIETAPVSGLPVLVYAAEREGLQSFMTVAAYHPEAGWCVDELREATHWRLLPPPPGAAPEPAETPVVTEALEAAKLVFEGVYGHGKRRMVDIHAETYEKIKAALAFSKGAQQK